MSNSTNNKIKQLREKILSFDFPYDASAWEQLEGRLDTSSTGYNLTAPLMGAAVLMIGLITISFALNSTPEKTSFAEPIVSEVEGALPKTGLVAASEELNPFQDVPETTTVYSLNDEQNHREVVRSLERSVSNIKSGKISHEHKEDELEIKEGGTVSKPEVLLSDHSTDVASMGISQKSICSGSKLDIFISGNFKGCQLWVDGNNYEAKERMAIVFAHPGEQKIELFNDAGVLINEQTVLVYPLPEVAIETSQTIDFGGRPVLEYSTSNVRDYNYTWFINDNFHSDETEGYMLMREQGSLSLRLEIINQYGCSKQSTEYIYTDREYNLLAPNSFSPNGDGRNETWMPAGLDLEDGTFVLDIFDRNQQLVYRTTSYHEPWNGDINGSPALSGDFYMWQAVVQTKKFGRQVYRGRILVL